MTIEVARRTTRKAEAPLSGRTYSGAELGEVLGVSRQAVSQWRAAGCPAVSPGRFRAADVVQWLRARDREAWEAEFLNGESRELFEKARADKVTAEARLAELELAKARGSLITVDAALAETSRVFDYLRARIVAVPGKEAHRFVGLKKMPQAIKELEAVTRSLLTVLSGPTDAPDVDGKAA